MSDFFVFILNVTSVCDLVLHLYCVFICSAPLTTLVCLITFSPSNGCLEDIAISDKTAAVPIDLHYCAIVCYVLECNKFYSILLSKTTPIYSINCHDVPESQEPSYKLSRSRQD